MKEKEHDRLKWALHCGETPQTGRDTQQTYLPLLALNFVSCLSKAQDKDKEGLLVWVSAERIHAGDKKETKLKGGVTQAARRKTRPRPYLLVSSRACCLASSFSSFPACTKQVSDCGHKKSPKCNWPTCLTHIVVSRRPSWVELGVELPLFPGQLVIFSLLLSRQGMPLLTGTENLRKGSETR